jgi:hypothetical protein
MWESSCRWPQGLLVVSGVAGGLTGLQRPIGVAGGLKGRRYPQDELLGTLGG